MVLEPAKNIEVTVTLPSQAQRDLILSNNLNSDQVLQLVRQNKMISKPVKDYFIKYGDKELDKTLPLHTYNIEKGAEVLKIVPYKINLHVIDEYCNKLCVFADIRVDKVLDMKQQIVGKCGFTQADYPQHSQMNTYCKEYNNPKRMKIFMNNGELYDSLEDHSLIKDYGLENNTELYMIYYDWGDHHMYFQRPIHLNEKGSLAYRGIHEHGFPNHKKTLLFFAHGAEGEYSKHKIPCQCSTLSLALRIQEQFDIPVENIRMYHTYLNQLETQLEMSPYKKLLIGPNPGVYSDSCDSIMVMVVDTKAKPDDPWAK